MKWKTALHRVRPGARDSDLDALRDRITVLEEQLAEARRHQMRTAELTDVVEALLIPLARRDEAEIDKVLRDYTHTLG